MKVSQSSIAIFEVYSNHSNNALIVVFEIDDNVKYTELHTNNAFRLVETVLVILIIDEDIEIKRDGKERNIIVAPDRQRCRPYIELKIYQKHRQ